MSRYLNPAKIGLLALIELYTEEAVPNDACLSVLSFITSHLLDTDLTAGLLGSRDRYSKAESAVPLATSIKDFEQVLSPFSAAVGLPGRRLWDIFLQKIWAIDSLDALHTFFNGRQLLLAVTKDELGRAADQDDAPPPTKIRLSRNSPFGTFVRRSQLEFTRLRFHDVAELWKEFVKYRQSTAGYWRRRNPSFGRLSFDNVLMTGEHEWGGDNTGALAAVAYGDMLTGDPDATVPASTDDVERLLEFQIEQMQSFGTRIPPEIKSKFQEILRDSYLVPSLSHYLSFLDAWKSGDYPSSFDHLHRYFDYTMQNRDRLFYQYALLNLAMLQADFGCYKEAVDAMLEAVSTARENRDMTCLNFSLNWLFHFGRAHPQLVSDLESNSMLGNGKDSLAYLRVKARESGMWVLWSSALLSEAKMILSNGDSVATALENIVRSSQLIVERNVKSMMGAQMSVNIALWDRLGVASLSAMTCEVFLRCHACNSSFEDELKVTCRLAILLASKGKYNEAFEKLEDIEPNSLRSWKANQYWQKIRGLLKLSQELHRSNLDGAEYLLSQLLQSKTEDLEPDLIFIIDFLHVDLLIRRDDLPAAFDKVDTLLATLRDEPDRDVSIRIRLLLAKARLLDLAGRPQRGLAVTLRAAGLAWRARLLPHLWQATAALAAVLTSLSEFAAAASILEAVIPRCLESGSDAVAGELYSRLADAHVGAAGEQLQTQQHQQQQRAAAAGRRAESFIRAREALDEAFARFAAVGDVRGQCEMLAKAATVMRAVGDDVLAEDYAARYLVLRKDSDMRNG